MIGKSLVLLAGLSAVACSSDATTGKTSSNSTKDSGPACNPEIPDACPMPSPTYATDVVPILQTKCNTCHDGKDGGPWPLTNHNDVVHWRTQVYSALVDCTMPPAAGSATLTAAERNTLIDWLACGAPDN